MPKDKMKNQNGSITVEAAIIVPIVIIAVMITLYIVLIIFQSCIMQLVANNAAERAADIWFKENSALETGKISKQDIVRLGLYRRWSFDNSDDEGILRENAANTLQRASILKVKNLKVDITHQNIILSQKINVELSASYSNPLGGLTRMWGLGSSTLLKVKAQAVIDDPSEFIRNSDFMLETASGLPVVSEFESKWNEIISKIVEYVSSLNKERKQID